MKRTMKVICLTLALLITSQMGIAQGKLMSKLVSKLAKSSMGDVNTLTTASLDSLVPVGGIGSHLYPAELGTLGQSFFGNWKTGGDQIAFTFFKKNTTKFYKIDGSITANGTPVGYLTAGTYGLISEANASPRKVEIVTSTGQKSGFTITPPKCSFKIRSINSQTDNISIDLSKDVTIEVDGLTESDGELMKIGLAINQVGIKELYDVCVIRAGSKLTIPAAAFRNINIKPGKTGTYGYKNSYLTVGIDRIENATDIYGPISVVEYTRSYSDGKFVTVSSEPSLNVGITVSGTSSNMDYNFFKPNAFMSRPSNQIKKIGVISFSIRGTTYHDVSSTTTSSAPKLNPFGGASVDHTKVTVSITKEFPWESVLEKIYPEMMGIVEAELKATVLPIDKVTNSESYKSIMSLTMDDANTTVDIAKAYRNTKVVSAFMPTGEGFGPNSLNQRLMSETMADALMTVTIDLETKEASGTTEMTPKFAFELIGKTNGGLVSTKFFTGYIKSSSAITLSKGMTSDQLAALIRQSDLLNVFQMALRELVAKEKANSDYETVWGLQR